QKGWSRTTSFFHHGFFISTWKKWPSGGRSQTKTLATALPLSLLTRQFCCSLSSGGASGLRQRSLFWWIFIASASWPLLVSMAFSPSAPVPASVTLPLSPPLPWASGLASAASLVGGGGVLPLPVGVPPVGGLLLQLTAIITTAAAGNSGSR